MSGTHYTDLLVWAVIVLLALGSFGLRFLFLGWVGNRPLPEWVLRHLRYTAVAILPGLVVPLVLWPGGRGSGTAPDPVHVLAVVAALGVGVVTKNSTLSIVTGGVVLAAQVVFG